MVVFGPWTETVLVISIGLLGIFFGKIFSRLRYPYWLVGYFIPFAIIILLIAGRFCNRLAFSVPFCSIIAGRVKFDILALVIPIGLITPMSRLRRRSFKVLTNIAMYVIVGCFCVLPFLAPALVKDSLLNSPTIIDSTGLCFQSTDYTCAPAAAVTALGKLGFQADEGQLAVLSHTSPVFGTLPICLANTLEDCFAAKGLDCRYRYFDSIEQLKKETVTIAMIKSSFFSDHCITILKVSDGKVLFADPVIGKVSMSYEQFEKIWRFCGITLKRNIS
jgi:hypothetical protein